MFRIGFVQAINKYDTGGSPTLVFGYLKSYLLKYFEHPFEMVRLVSFSQVKYCDVLAISSTSQDYSIACRIAKWVKRKSPKTVVVLGGHHVTYLPDTMTDDFDFGIIGEGELTFLKLMDHVAFRLPYLPKGVVFHSEGSRVLTPKREVIEFVDSIPPPVQTHFPPSFMTSRGCPYRCKFCSSSAFWGGTRFFSAEYVVKEFEKLLDGTPEWWVPFANIQDDLFVADRKRFEKMVDLMKQKGINKRIRFAFLAVRANLVDEWLCSMIKELNVGFICFGVESGSDRILKLMGKGVTVERNQKALDTAFSAGIPCAGSFIVGWPSETEEEVRETYEFLLRNVRENKLGSSAPVNILTPMPGVPVWDDAVTSGDIDLANFDWKRLGIFASYRNSKIKTFEEWVNFRRRNNSVYLNEKTLPQERLYDIMAEYEKLLV
jgi:anaerobic magnesium-protoporphyrin IX monomethyl ester cyclase